MSDEMKLLRALCEALGFDIKTHLDYEHRKESKHKAMAINMGGGEHGRVLLCSGPHGMLDIDNKGMYTSTLKKPVLSYSLVKKL